MRGHILQEDLEQFGQGRSPVRLACLGPLEPHWNKLSLGDALSLVNSESKESKGIRVGAQNPMLPNPIRHPFQILPTLPTYRRILRCSSPEVKIGYSQYILVDFIVQPSLPDRKLHNPIHFFKQFIANQGRQRPLLADPCHAGGRMCSHLSSKSSGFKSAGCHKSPTAHDTIT